MKRFLKKLISLFLALAMCTNVFFDSQIDAIAANTSDDYYSTYTFSYMTESEAKAFIGFLLGTNDVSEEIYSTDIYKYLIGGFSDDAEKENDVRIAFTEIVTRLLNARITENQGMANLASTNICTFLENRYGVNMDSELANAAINSEMSTIKDAIIGFVAIATETELVELEAVETIFGDVTAIMHIDKKIEEYTECIDAIFDLTKFVSSVQHLDMYNQFLIYISNAKCYLNFGKTELSNAIMELTQDVYDLQNERTEWANCIEKIVKAVDVFGFLDDYWLDWETDSRVELLKKWACFIVFTQKASEEYVSPVMTDYSLVSNSITTSDGTVYTYSSREYSDKYELTHEVESADLKYEETTGGIKITDYIGYGGKYDHMSIPSSIDGKDVVEIGSYAFEDMAIESVIIPDTVVQIDDYAFYGCCDLSKIVVLNSDVSFGTGAFDWKMGDANQTINETYVYGNTGSTAESFCADNAGFAFEDISWNGSDIWGIAAINGEYHVHCGAELAYISDLVSSGQNLDGFMVVLENDIDMGNSVMQPIGISSENYFSGNFDGRGNELTSFAMGYNDDVAGLFGYVMSENASFENVKITGNRNSAMSSNMGGLIGYVQMTENSTLTVSNVVSNIYDSNIGYGNRGGIVGSIVGNGENKIQFTDCSNIQTIGSSQGFGGNLTGGILAKAELTETDSICFTKCLNSAKIIGKATRGYGSCSIGGILGSGTNGEYSFDQCLADGQIVHQSYTTSCGGLVGSFKPNKFEINDCAVFANLQSVCSNGDSLAGGLIGNLSGTNISDNGKSCLINNTYVSAVISAWGKSAFINSSGGINANYEITVKNSFFDKSKTTTTNNGTDYITYCGFLSGQKSTSSENYENVHQYTASVLRTDKTIYQTWDFDNIWDYADSGYPILRCFPNIEPCSEHIYDEAITAPTCTAQGYTTYTCQNCGYIYKSNYTEKIDHDYNFTKTVASTCTEKGYDLYTCSVCSRTEKRNYVAVNGHTYAYTKTIEPTCKEEGYDLYTCSVCGVTENRNAVSVTGHNYENSICKVCGACKPESAELNADGYYEISSAGQLVWFAALVNGDASEASFDAQDTAANAVLTADITLPGEWTPIGSKASLYIGTFDGNMHAVTFAINSTDNAQGLFGYVGGGVVIENIVIRGSVSGAGYCAGLVGISNSAGIITITNCGNEATVTGTGVNAAGILASVWNGTAVITDCYNTGTISGSKESAGISGWLGKNAVVANCFNSGKISGNDSGKTFARYNTSYSVTFENCYQLSTVGSQSGITSKVSEKFASGEVTYLLNGSENDDGGLVWKQTLATDSYPNFTGASVIYTDDQYVNHTHIWAKEWTTDADAHYHKCTMDGCTIADYSTVTDADCAYGRHSGTQSYFEQTVCDTCGVKFGEALKDEEAPTGTIDIVRSKWNSFVNAITFDIFLLDEYKVTITAEDNSDQDVNWTAEYAVKVQYYVSNESMTEDEVKALTDAAWTTYDNSLSISDENKYVVYAKLTDYAENVTYISTDGFVFDKTAPIISGVTDGATYCEAQKATVDETYIDTVTVNGTVVALEDGKFTVSPASDPQTIVATDEAGNATSVTITVNDGHTFTKYVSNVDATCTVDGTKTAKCDYCDVTDTVTDEGSKLSHSMMPHEVVTATCTKEGNVAYWSCSICNLNYDSATGDNVLTDVTTAIDPTNHKAAAGWTQEDDKHYHVCENGCGTHLDEVACAGGTATCHSKAVCDTCGNEYGSLSPDNHDGEIEVRAKKDAACMQEGYTGDTYCLGCNMRITDGTKIAALGHDYEAIVAAPTCTEDGYTTYTCARCGNIYIDDETEALDHDYGTVIYGWRGYTECAATHTCTRCEDEETVTTTDITSAVTIPATCESGGVRTCTATFAESWAGTRITTETITKLGHDWKDTTYEWSDDKSTCTATRICKSNAEHTDKVETTVTSKQTKKPTYNEKGEITYTATFDADWAVTQTVTEEIAALPTPMPSATPTPEATARPTATPTVAPSETPSAEPSETPTPSATSSATPTATPIATPTAEPTAIPTVTPTETVAPTYHVEIEETGEGDVSVMPTNPKAGDTVTITVKSENGEQIEQIVVTTENGEAVTLTYNGDGSYLFTQPIGVVTVTVVFTAGAVETPSAAPAVLPTPSATPMAEATVTPAATAMSTPSVTSTPTSKTTAAPTAASSNMSTEVPSVEPKESIAPMKSEVPSILYGDADGNGEIDASDALAVLRAVVKLADLSDTQKTAADVDGDGAITANDALLILKHVVKLINTFPVEQ